MPLLPDNEHTIGSGQAAAFSIENKGRLISIISTKGAVTQNAQLRVTTIDGNEFEYGPFSLSSDFEPPVFLLDSDIQNGYFNTSIPSQYY